MKIGLPQVANYESLAAATLATIRVSEQAPNTFISDTDC